MSQPEDSSQNINVGNVADSRLNVAQDIQGSLTQINADVFYANVYSPIQVLQPTGKQSAEAGSHLSRQEYRQRQVLLTKVKTFWVEDVLERSLHAKALIELGLEKRFDTVQHPFESLEYTVADSESDPLPPGSQVEEVFTSLGPGRTLLILGEPGSGKTTMLLKLTKNLIVQAETNANLPIPVVFNLSSWTSPQQSIAAWLLEELATKYQVSRPLAQTWIDDQSMLLLLDGLDEVATDLQDDCVRAINQFLHHHGQTETVVCSRIKDYLALPERLQLRSALYLQPLTTDQIHQYLDEAGSQLEAIKTLLQEDAALQELARSPLTLSIMTLAYQGKSLADIPQTGSLEERRRHLLEVYVKRMFQRKGLRRTYPDDKVIRWLTWLAKQMVRKSQTVFLIESVQPDWLPTKLDRRFYEIGIRIVLIVLWGTVHVGLLAGHGNVKTTFEFGSAALGILAGAGGGIACGLISGATFGLLQGIWSRLLNGLILAAIYGPIFARVYTGGIAFACIYAALGIYLVAPLQQPIEPVEISKLSWGKIRNYFALGVVV
ncbi:MAG: NACHT domain-containing protein, partial [Phormidesmis sp.]